MEKDQLTLFNLSKFYKFSSVNFINKDTSVILTSSYLLKNQTSS